MYCACVCVCVCVFVCVCVCVRDSILNAHTVYYPIGIFEL